MRDADCYRLGVRRSVSSIRLTALMTGGDSLVMSAYARTVAVSPSTRMISFIVR